MATINQPQRRESDLDIVLKGLQAIGGIMDIKKTIEYGENLKAQQALREQQLEQRKTEFAQKQADQERIQKGDLSIMEAVKAKIPENYKMSDYEKMQGEVGIGPVDAREVWTPGSLNVRIGGKEVILSPLKEEQRNQERQFEKTGKVSRKQYVNLLRAFEPTPEGEKGEFNIITPEGDKLSMRKRSEIDDLTASQILSANMRMLEMENQQKRWQAEQDRLSKEAEARRKEKEIQTNIRQSNIENKRTQDEKNKLDQNVQKFSSALGDLPKLLNQIEELDKEIGGISGKGDIPGFGGSDVVDAAKIAAAQASGGALDPAAFKDRALRVRQKVAGLRNTFARANFGAAQSPSEMRNLGAELGTGIITTDEALRNGLVNIRERLKAELSSIQAGFDPRVIEEYKKRGGQTTTGSAIFKQKGSSVNRKNLEPETNDPREAEAIKFLQRGN